jgi:uncharacterized membrane protein YphA (DoxX/SURF4 family)
MTILLWILRILFGGVFLIAGLLKVGDPLAFQQDILAYRLTDNLIFTGILALYLPWLEILCGATLLLAPLVPREAVKGFELPAVMILEALMLAFALGYFSTVLRGIDVSCGCFGEISEGWPAWLVIARDATLLLVGGALLFLLVEKSAREKPAA